MSRAVARSTGLVLVVAWGLVGAPSGAPTGRHAVAAAGPSAPPGAAPGAAQPDAPGEAVISLKGPFGRVPGVPADSIDPTGLGLPALDVFVRGARLRIGTFDPEMPLSDWSVMARPLDTEASRDVPLGSAQPSAEPAEYGSFPAPAEPGDYLLLARATPLDAQPLDLAWRIVVPDREPPPDGILDVPPPFVELTSGDTTVAGERGHGCYVYTCVEVGGLPALAGLDPLDVPAMTPVRLALSDGSGIVAWAARYLPTDQPGAEPRPLARRPEGDPVASDAFTAPGAGEWLVVVEVVYDRERGWSQAFFHLRSH